MNPTIEQLNLVATFISAFATLAATAISVIVAVAAGVGLFLAYREQKISVREDFILWAMERLRKDDLREARGKIYAMTDDECKEAVQAACKEETTPILMAIRQVALSFDEIGYFVYKMQIVEFRDILDMYSQTIKIWTRIAPIIQAWRTKEGPTSFVYFEMLARQKRLDAKPEFGSATELYPPINQA